MSEQLKLPIDWDKCDKYIIDRMAEEGMKDEYFFHWDQAYELLWDWFKTELRWENENPEWFKTELRR